VEEYGVEELFTGLGRLNEAAVKAPSQATLLLMRDGAEVTQQVQTQSGTWTLRSDRLRLAAGSHKGLIIWSRFGEAEFAIQEWPREGSPHKPAAAEDVPLIPNAAQRTMFLALVVGGQSAPSRLRITRVSRSGGTAKVEITGSTKLLPFDPESPGVVVALYAVSGVGGDAADIWPRQVEVWTNGKRGFPHVPLHVKRGEEFQPQAEPAFRIDD